MKISVVIPAYNEETKIEKTLLSYLNFLSKNFENYELIAVNDGSTDSTAEIIQKFRNVICISYPKNRGKGYAVKRGILRATGDYIFFTDADLSFSPTNILSVMKIFKKHCVNGVVGIRENKSRDYPLLRRFVSCVFCTFVRNTLNLKLHDTQCGFKAFDKKTAKQLFSMSQLTKWGFDFEIIYLSENLGKILYEFPISFSHYEKPESHIFANSLSMIRDVIFLKFKDGLYDKKTKNYR